jgi:hypothetical protein
VICGTVSGITAVILGVPYPLALSVIAGILDLVPTIGATLAGVIIALVALSVSPGTAIAFVIVIVVYQQIENYVLQPTIIGRAADVSGFTVLVSTRIRLAVRADRRDHRRPDRSGDPDDHERADGRAEGSDRGRGQRKTHHHVE